MVKDETVRLVIFKYSKTSEEVLGKLLFSFIFNWLTASKQCFPEGFYPFPPAVWYKEMLEVADETGTEGKRVVTAPRGPSQEEQLHVRGLRDALTQYLRKQSRASCPLGNLSYIHSKSKELFWRRQVGGRMQNPGEPRNLEKILVQASMKPGGVFCKPQSPPINMKHSVDSVALLVLEAPWVSQQHFLR